MVAERQGRSTAPRRAASPTPRDTTRDGGQESNGSVTAQDDAAAGGYYSLPALNPTTLRHWRVSHGYTAEELGSALGVHEQTIHRWERGEREAPWRMLQLALHGLVFEHGPTCRCSHPRCRYHPNRYAANGRAYDPR